LNKILSYMEYFKKENTAVVPLAMEKRILILDFGSQYTQLIARRIRELCVYCEVHPYHYNLDPGPDVAGVILSGSPRSVRENDPLVPARDWLSLPVPVLGICYGAQYMAQFSGGEVSASNIREYGRAQLEITDSNNPLLHHLPATSTVWMSHSDTISNPGKDFRILARTETIPVAAFAHSEKKQYGLQFHPEVVHTEFGMQMLRNFVFDICGASATWTARHFIEESVASIRAEAGEHNVILGLSGGVDSSVAALLLHKALGDRLFCIFVDNGLLRKNEFRDVLASYEGMGLQVLGVDARERFYAALDGISDPEQKRKTIGRLFIDVFEEQAHPIPGVAFLGQGTIYPDVIESVSVHGPSVTIKSHHNVGGLPEIMKLRVIEPLKNLFKDEVRRVGAELGLDNRILHRHPFPGPGLAIRILGAVTEAQVKLLQEADALFVQALHEFGYYDKVWQAGAILLPVQSVGVMGDERTYEQVVCLRAVTSQDGMTADWYDFPHSFLAEVSNRIINRVRGINRVVYDISSKPPATIEWE
jgi:GMP synthase (glutamine-hydrolysing)